MLHAIDTVRPRFGLILGRFETSAGCRLTTRQAQPYAAALQPYGLAFLKTHPLPDDTFMVATDEEVAALRAMVPTTEACQQMPEVQGAPNALRRTYAVMLEQDRGMLPNHGDDTLAQALADFDQLGSVARQRARIVETLRHQAWRSVVSSFADQLAKTEALVFHVPDHAFEHNAEHGPEHSHEHGFGQGVGTLPLPATGVLNCLTTNGMSVLGPGGNALNARLALLLETHPDRLAVVG
ncbi:MAG: hypothetical protein KC476_03900 [Cyanobacteria bacterium HKST-UBA06]|nr:hypothetical protein [Cyanobacteria bacterium HKST-UBA06]